jgi:hypothetical protein
MTMPHGPANINAVPVFHLMMWCLGDSAHGSAALHCAVLFERKRIAAAVRKPICSTRRQSMRRQASQNPREAEARRGAGGALTES